MSVVVVVALLSLHGLAARGPCATMAARDLPASALATVGLGARPAVVDFADSAVHPIRVHRGGGATPEQAALVLREADLAWTEQVDGAGFAPPLADDDGSFDDDDGGEGRLDVYLDPLPAGVGAFTVSGGTGSTRPVFISIDPQQLDDTITVAVHHEFQHALQFAVDARESVMWFESNAVAWEVKSHPEIDDWLDLLTSFQSLPQAPLFTDSLDFDPFARSETYEYGAALFVLYLDDVHGDGDGRFLQSLWAASAQEGADNEPDWLDALGDVVDVDDVIADFAGWRVLTGDLDVDGDGFAGVTDGRATVFARAINVDSLAGVARVTSDVEGPFVGGGCAMFKGAAPVDEDVPVRIAASSVDGHDLVAVSVVVKDGAAVRGVSDKGVDVSLDAAVGRGAAVVLAVCDLEDADADDDPVFAPIRVTLSRTDVVSGEGEGDDVGEGEGEEGEGEDVVDCGCGCQQNSAPTTTEPAGSPNRMRQNVGYLGFAVGVFAFALRAWRHQKRKRLYKRD